MVFFWVLILFLKINTSKEQTTSRKSCNELRRNFAIRAIGFEDFLQNIKTCWEDNIQPVTIDETDQFGKRSQLLHASSEPDLTYTDYLVPVIKTDPSFVTNENDLNLIRYEKTTPRSVTRLSLTGFYINPYKNLLKKKNVSPTQGIFTPTLASILENLSSPIQQVNLISSAAKKSSNFLNKLVLKPPPVDSRIYTKQSKEAYEQIKRVLEENPSLTLPPSLSLSLLPTIRSHPTNYGMDLSLLKYNALVESLPSHVLGPTSFLYAKHTSPIYHTSTTDILLHLNKNLHPKGYLTSVGTASDSFENSQIDQSMSWQDYFQFTNLLKSMGYNNKNDNQNDKIRPSYDNLQPSYVRDKNPDIGRLMTLSQLTENVPLGIKRIAKPLSSSISPRFPFMSSLRPNEEMQPTSSINSLVHDDLNDDTSFLSTKETPDHRQLLKSQYDAFAPKNLEDIAARSHITDEDDTGAPNLLKTESQKLLIRDNMENKSKPSGEFKIQSKNQENFLKNFPSFNNNKTNKKLSYNKITQFAKTSNQNSAVIFSNSGEKRNTTYDDATKSYFENGDNYSGQKAGCDMTKNFTNDISSFSKNKDCHDFLTQEQTFISSVLKNKFLFKEKLRNITNSKLPLDAQKINSLINVQGNNGVFSHSTASGNSRDENYREQENEENDEPNMERETQTNKNKKKMKQQYISDFANTNSVKDLLDIKYAQIENKLINDLKLRQAVLQKLEQESINLKPDDLADFKKNTSKKENTLDDTNSLGRPVSLSNLNEIFKEINEESTKRISMTNPTAVYDHRQNGLPLADDLSFFGTEKKEYTEGDYKYKSPTNKRNIIEKVEPFSLATKSRFKLKHSNPTAGFKRKSQQREIVLFRNSNDDDKFFLNNPDNGLRHLFNPLDFNKKRNFTSIFRSTIEAMTKNDPRLSKDSLIKDFGNLANFMEIANQSYDNTRPFKKAGLHSQGSVHRSFNAYNSLPSTPQHSNLSRNHLQDFKNFIKTFYERKTLPKEKTLFNFLSKDIKNEFWRLQNKSKTSFENSFNSDTKNALKNYIGIHKDKQNNYKNENNIRTIQKLGPLYLPLKIEPKKTSEGQKRELKNKITKTFNLSKLKFGVFNGNAIVT